MDSFQLIPTESSSLHMLDAIQDGGVFSIEPYGDWAVYGKGSEFVGSLVQAGLVTDSFPPKSTLDQVNFYAQRWVSTCMILNKSRELVLNHWMNQPTRNPTNPGARPQKLLWLPQPEKPAAYKMRATEVPEIAPDRGVLFNHTYGFHFVRPVESGFSGKLVLHGVVAERFDNRPESEAKTFLQTWAEAARHYVASMIFAQEKLPPQLFFKLISYRGPESNAPRDFDPLKIFEDAESVTDTDVALYLNARKGLSATLRYGMWAVWPDGEHHSGELIQYRARTAHFERFASEEVIEMVLEWTRYADEGEQPPQHP